MLMELEPRSFSSSDAEFTSLSLPSGFDFLCLCSNINAFQLDYNNVSPMSPFRSRSGSRSQQNVDTISVVFDVTVSDLEEGSQHCIRGVSGRKGSNLTLRNRQLVFRTDRSYWGQRADMIIQKQLAAPDMMGQGCHVFAGPMRFYFYDNSLQSSGASSLTNWCW
jgi:hypothetical protein